ncbi:uncharacterized protein LOC111519167 [Drosophila willistoni]|uniref:uncharacterized protein LOC111519167 n=1 Tax=Drosophila willistoni TaxID=7260 RepID=UPI00017D88CD|nr:uncharacterized protein LOC111519167 [Drosophila willistoni]
MSHPTTPVTSRGVHVRGRKRINSHPIQVLRMEDPWPHLMEMVKTDGSSADIEEMEKKNPNIGQAVNANNSIEKPTQTDYSKGSS